LTIESADVAAASSAIEHLDVDLPDIASDIHGPLRATVNLGGRVDALEARADVTSESLTVPGVAPAAVQATVAITPNRVDVPTLTATIGRASLTGHALVDLAGKSLAGTFSLDAPEASELLTGLPDNARVSGPIAATATLGGAPSAPDVRVDLQGSGLTFAGQPVDRLASSARITSDTAFIDSLNLTTGTGTVTGTGSYAWGTRAYTAKLEGADIAWRGQIAGDAETEVRITQLTFVGNGTIDRPGGEGKVAFQLAGGTAGDIVQSGEADIQLNGESALVDARVPSLGAHVKSTILTRTPYTYDATADIAKMDLAPFAALAGLPAGGVLGRLTLSATAHGEASNAAETTEVSANLQQIAATVGEVPIWLPSPSKMTWRKDDLRIESLTLGFGSGMLTASGRLAPGNDAQWTSTFNGELGDLIRAARGVTDVPAELSAGGALAAKWESTGGIDRSNATLTLTNGQVTWADVPPITALALQGGFDGMTITVSSLTGTWQEGGISGTATLPRALVDGSVPDRSGPPGHVQMKVTGLTQSAIAPWVESDVLARIVGRVSASFDADILGTSVNDIAGTLVLDEAVLNLADIEVQQAHPTKIGIKDGRVSMDDVSWTAGGGPLALTGSVVLDAPEGPTLDLALKGDLNLGLLSAFAPTTWTAGSALVDVKAGGLASDPDVQGRIDLQDGEVAVFSPRLILYELNGPIAIDRRRVSFGGVGGSLNGGTIRLDGQLGFGGGAANTGQLIIELGQVALEYPAGLQSEVSGLLTYGPRGQDWQLGGDVRIARSSYRENISLPALAAARRTRPPVAVDAEPTFLDRLRLNLFVSTEEDLGVDNNYGRLEAGAAVRVIGTANEPAINGRVTMREGGQVFLAGRTFRLERGAISFTNPSRIEPELDIELRTLASNIDVAVSLTGTMDQLKTEVRSTSPEHTDKEAQQALYGNLGTEDAATLLSAELLGATGRAVGLDTLRIERGTESEDFRNDPTLIVEELDDDTSTRLTLAKRIRPDVEVIISRSLQDSSGVSAAVSYNIRRNIEIRASQRESTDRAIALRHEITFGGGASARARDATPQPKVAAVHITGEPGRPEPEIRALIHLDEGDRFAFHEWQRDVDRIKESYTERGYYEARVRPTRDASADNQSVTLTYRIDQGPKTNVVIEGHPLHNDLLQDLHDAWSRAIFDRFLVDDARWRVQQDLMSEGYVGSKIDPRVVQPNPQTKELRIAVVPGTLVSGREIRFAGNAGFNRGRLEGVLAEQELQDVAWLDQAKLKTALETFYREQGYLSVKVTAAAPMVEGNRGVLPVTIEEGRRFAFVKPTLHGVADKRQMPLDQWVNGVLHEGQPYDATVVDLARRQVERFYLTQGFNNARTETRSTSDQQAGTVSVVFTVDEGLQQVLREVTTEGDDRTRDGVVRRALRLTEGAPVDLAQWGLARKRMYDTNVFAQVDIEPVPIEQTEEDKAAGIEPVRAVVRVVEYPEWRLRYGLQVNDQRTGDEDISSAATGRQQSLGVLADIQNRNIFGRAIAGGFAARVERDRQIGSLFASNGSFFGLPIRTQAFLFTSRERDREPLDVLYDRVGTTVEQRWQALRRTELVYGYRYDQTRFYENAPAPEIDDTNHTGKVTAALIFDHRDDLFSATKGWFTAANYEHAARMLGGDSRNSKLLVQQHYFRSLGKMTLASRVQVGAAFGKDRLTTENAFVLGGATTVRGYSEDALGPKDLSGFPIGQALILLNQEVRFPIKGWVKGVGFVDAGNTFNTRGELSFSDLSVGYGFGIRLDTPFAMLRVDFGVPGSTLPGSTRQANSIKNGRWYIGIGHVF
jgi:outer membrane protein assembly complex protein YaeT